jgi:antitoxin component of MazEF toxin-antitoxin module
MQLAYLSRKLSLPACGIGLKVSVPGSVVVLGMPLTSWSLRSSSLTMEFIFMTRGRFMRNAEHAMVLSVPPNVLTALHITASDAVHWEVRNGEAVLKAVARRSVDDVAGMLAPQLKGRRIRWSAVATSARAVWGQVR